MTLHLVKLCVGASSVEDLSRYQATRKRAEHVTRMMPARRDDVLAGGSLYWVISGEIRARQHIIGLEAIRDAEGIARCRIILDRAIILTKPWPRRPFQGWRYLQGRDAPPDLSTAGGDDLPDAMKSELAALGLL